MNDVFTIANYFIDKANSQVIDIDGSCEGLTNLKLQKVLYFSQAVYLANRTNPLFLASIEAWQFGPVVPVVYHKYKNNGNNPIISIDRSNEEISKESLVILDAVWGLYGKYSASELVEISHTHKPWKDAFNSEDKTISHESIREHYSGYYVFENDT